MILSRGETRRVSTVRELRDALAAANRTKTGTTLLLEDGTYLLDAPALEIQCPGLIIRSAKGNREAVILRGPDEGTNAAVANVFLVSANDVVIADMTLGYCRHHGIQVRGEPPFHVSGLRVHNCRILNCNQQFIKGSSSDSDPLGATDGCIEQCLFEFTSGWAYQYYTGGIDIHKGVNWVVRDNLFRSLRVPAGQAGIAEHAVHFWKRCSTRPQNILVERNAVVNCDRGIGFGLGSAEGGHQGGTSTIRNNMVFNDGLGPHTDVGIGLEYASDVHVDNNTVVVQNYWAPMEYRFAGSSNLVFRNNLVSGPLQRRDDAPVAAQVNNLQHIESSWFRDLPAGNLRLTSAARPAIDAGASLDSFHDDVDGQPRPRGAGWEVGACEFDPNSLAGASSLSHTNGPAINGYYPPPESAGGWRTLDKPEDIRRLGGADPAKLSALRAWLLQSDDRNFAAVVIHRGYIVLEVERGNSSKTDTRRVASVSKAVCATVLAIASERSQHGLTARKMSFDDRAFDFIPWAQPLSDPRKAAIKVKQLLNHTSGICPEAAGAPNDGTWEYILGHTGDARTARLAFDPGTACGYSTHALAHAALVCETVTGMPYDQFAVQALFKPLGIEHWSFQYYEGGEKYGRHPSHGLGMPAHDLARIAYCMLREGRWESSQVIPKWFVDQTATLSHDVKTPELRWKFNPQIFTLGWELPARHWGPGDRTGEGIPADAREKPGSGGQLIAFVPSLDLVITRQTGSSGEWAFEECLRRACATVLPQ